MSKPIYSALLSSAKPISLAEGTLVIAVPNNVIRDWLSENCSARIKENLVSNGLKDVEFVVGSKELFNTPPLESQSYQIGLPPVPPVETGRLYLNPKYTFDTFVVGHGNRFAHAAAQAVAETPAKAYNPLFIYGGVGLGKTHLMQAIAHYVVKKQPDASALYITSEKFTNDLINSIRDDAMKDFRARYRSIGLLMVDDIQFLAGKERTQEEFFHTFNALHEANKQIVISSDRPPKEIPTLEERLRSRFEWGLIADIQSPDLETRIAILKKKAELEDLAVSDEVLTLIASKVSSNIRELEGALIRLIAYASLIGDEITLSMADGVLKDVVYPSKGKSPITIDLVKKITAGYYDVKIDDLSAKTRKREIATARQVAMYVAREVTDASLPKIGQEFGGRDHTTVMHACDKISGEKQNKLETKEAVESIINNVRKYSP
ncbi:chromosomal replication initiator protein DnaA [Candidatus Margulisiibacteriota bacterium]